MLSLEDCVAFSGLTPDQLDAVACYKHLAPILAAEWAEGVLETEDGCTDIEHIIAAETALACSHHLACADRWRVALAEFRSEHAMA